MSTNLFQFCSAQSDWSLFPKFVAGFGHLSLVHSSIFIPEMLPGDFIYVTYTPMKLKSQSSLNRFVLAKGQYIVCSLTET
jgi:hypothetical protein